MPNDIAIKVENISKKYLIGENKSYPTLRDKLVELPNRIFKGPTKTKDFWALKDVSFEVKRGEVVGIIGRNGAGKSTLLKILARITEPTTGQITMHGRVASMLEVGTGFNPELTGRENIYLNGAIIGMKKSEIKAKFDDIVEFSGVGKFLDTPVKHYSSGMYVRLAFAVAAHLDADVLLVDEVLAVGDAEFQKKCLSKISEISNSGKTILFVSHNILSIQNVCKSIMLFDSGTLNYKGIIKVGINKYLKSSLIDNGESIINFDQRRSGSGLAKFTKIQFKDASLKKIDRLLSGQDINIVMYYVSSEGKLLKNVVASIGIDDSNGNRISTLSTELTNQNFSVLPPSGSITLSIPSLPLNKGLYHISMFMKIDGVISDWILKFAKFEVEVGDFYKSGMILEEHGLLLIPHSFMISTQGIDK